MDFFSKDEKLPDKLIKTQWVRHNPGDRGIAFLGHGGTFSKDDG